MKRMADVIVLMYQSKYLENKQASFVRIAKNLLETSLKQMEMQGIEPGAFHMQSERSTTELHPLLM
jgi:hypothetical protein